MKTLFEYIKFLEIKKNINLKIITKKNRYAEAEYTPQYSASGRLLGHDIVVYLKDNTREFETLLAHELIHAWQEENKCWENHGEFFRLKAFEMEAHFGLRQIYLPDIDEE